MRTLSPQELKARLDRGERLRLVMTMSPLHFQACHIPGSECRERLEEFADLPTDEPLVLYCSAHECRASIVTYGRLSAAGYSNLWRLEGGLAGWVEAGHPIEGTSAQESRQTP